MQVLFLTHQETLLQWKWLMLFSSRRLFHIVSYFLFFLNIFVGLFSCLIRIFYAILLGALFLPRLQKSALPRDWELFDPGTWTRLARKQDVMMSLCLAREINLFDLQWRAKQTLHNYSGGEPHFYRYQSCWACLKHCLKSPRLKHSYYPHDWNICTYHTIPTTPRLKYAYVPYYPHTWNTCTCHTIGPTPENLYVPYYPHYPHAWNTRMFHTIPTIPTPEILVRSILSPLSPRLKYAYVPYYPHTWNTCTCHTIGPTPENLYVPYYPHYPHARNTRIFHTIPTNPRLKLLYLPH